MTTSESQIIVGRTQVQYPRFALEGKRWATMKPAARANSALNRELMTPVEIGGVTAGPFPARLIPAVIIIATTKITGVAIN